MEVMTNDSVGGGSAPALLGASDFDGVAHGGEAAMMAAGTLVAQCADIAGLCAAALSTCRSGDGRVSAAARLMAKCRDDLETAVMLMD